jgi:molybdate transport system substrate-binding protein
MDEDEEAPIQAQAPAGLMLPRRALLMAGLAVAVSACARDEAPSFTPLTVYAAISLQDPLKVIATAYRAKGGGEIGYNFAGSQVLARQIEQGAQADVFISADLAWMDYLEERDLIRTETRRDLASTRLALIAPADSTTTLQIGPGFALREALGEGRLALADPTSVPAGRYARAALVSLGVWDQVADRTAGAENVRAAMAFVARGEAPFGVVYETDARAEPGVRQVGLFPDGSHPPIVYPAAAVAVTDSPEASAGFIRFLAGPEAKAAFQRYGFTPAG